MVWYQLVSLVESFAKSRIYFAEMKRKTHFTGRTPRRQQGRR